MGSGIPVGQKGCEMTRITLIQTLRESRLAWLVLLAGMALTVSAWYAASSWEREKAQRDFDAHVKDTFDAVQQRVDYYTYVLHGARGLFAASDTVTRDEWRRYNSEAGLGAHHPGVHSFAFIRYVPLREKARFEQRVRGDASVNGRGYPDFAIVPPGQRDEYFSIEYVEPENLYGKLLGTDRGAEPDTRKTLERARDTGRAAASGRLSGPVEHLESTHFFLIVLPIYRNGSNPLTVSERRAALLGFVAARIELETLFKGVVGAGVLKRLFFELYDGGDAEGAVKMTPGNLLYAVDGESHLHAKAAPFFSQQESMQMAGRNWLFYFGSRTGNGAGGSLPLALLLGGGVTSALLFVLVLILVTQRQRVMGEVARQKSLFSQVMDALPVNIFLKDKEFRFVLVNEEAACTLGVPKEKVPGKSDFDLFPHEVAARLREYDEHVRSVERLVMREERLVSNGRERCMLAGKEIIRLPGSSEPMLLGFSFDISDRKKAERELERQQHFVRQVIDNAPNIIFVKDYAGKFLLVNQAGASYWGLTPERMVGRNQAEVFPQSEESQAISLIDQLVIDERENIDLEESITLPNGDALWLSLIKRPLPQPDGKVHVLCIATDITERKHAELALRESEERLRAILDNTTSVVFLKDLEGRYLLTNSEYEKRSGGLTREQIAGKTDYDFFPKAVADVLHANDQAALRAGKPLEFEERIPGERGERIYVAVKFVLRNSAGEPYALAGIATDITERLRLEQEAARARANELSRSVIDALGEGVVGMDTDLRITFVNPEAEKMLGRSEAELAGEPVCQVVYGCHSGERCVRGECHLREVAGGGESLHADDAEFVRGDGGTFPASFVATAMVEGKRVRGVALSFQDTTRRKQVEEAVRRMERQQRALLDNLPDMAWLKDEESRYIMVNEAVARACGQTPEALAGKNDLDLWPREIAELYRGDDREIMATGRSKRIEEPFEGKDGKRLWIETIKSPIYDDAGKVIGTAGIARDMTARHDSEDLVNRHLAELARVNAELDEFTYVASHDLQEPVRKLLAFSEWLRKDLGGELPPRAEQDLQFITDAAQRMQHLVGDLLALSRTGKLSMVREHLALDEAVDRALDALALRIAESGATISRASLPKVWGDLTLLTQLYQNLISNALKFVDGRPPEIALTAEQVGGEWVFGVRDQGIGIPAKYVGQIFQPFKRLHGRGQFEGSGIGLSICRKVVERHCGRIWVESEENRGAWFKFTLGKQYGQ